MAIKVRKTERMVILVEKRVKKQLERLAQERAESIGSIIRPLLVREITRLTKLKERALERRSGSQK